MTKGGEGHGKEAEEVLNQAGAASEGAAPTVCAHGSLGRQCRVCELEQEKATLRAALAQVEWSVVFDECPWCCRVREQGHAPDCARQAALGVGRGEGA